MSKRVLIVWGGFEGHTPWVCAERFGTLLEAEGCEVEIRDTLDAFTDTPLMKSVNLIVPVWTMGDLTPEQATGITETVHAGCGVAGLRGQEERHP